jgi:MoaA/NifB/PqqE/SkfB family radical SAM enzyme
LTIDTFNTRLEEALSNNYDNLDIYFTGGEPFVNPHLLEMLKEGLKHANTTILTNATRISKATAKKLANLQANSQKKLIFRISVDGSNKSSNDRIRGKGAFDRTMKGVENLIEQGFNPIVTAMRSWSLLESGQKEEEFIDLLVQQGIPREKQLLKILPPIRIGREVSRDRGYTANELFTEECFTDYDYNNLQCSKCRMVSENGVWVCPILINEDHAKMGDTLKETEHPYEMVDMACWTCRMDGMICTND